MERGGTSSLGDDRGGSGPKGQSTGAADPPASRPLPTSAVDPATLDPSQENGLPSARSLRRGSAGITPDGRLRSGRLAGLSMGAAILTLAWPILAESFLGSLVGLTDTYLSAQISEAATDAIAGASYVMWFIGLVVMSVASGATALVSRAARSHSMATDPLPAPVPSYKHPKKNWRLKRGATPQWYKQRAGIRTKAQSGAARVARFRPPGIKGRP